MLINHELKSCFDFTESQKMQTIGREVKISLPNQRLYNLDAKVDTGAYHSAIHCHEVQKKLIDGKTVLSVRFLDPEHPAYHEKELIFEKFKKTIVTSSFGNKQQRYIIKLKVKINDKIYIANFTLANRSRLKYPILLGRTLLRGNFLVDPSRKQ
ncbi:ATP-dependent zinc protease [Candidatus Saccharibacteria bacterium]|nr:ATP-dependent zinc protease [Candidatus Saccharibacteria bacterium]